MDPLKHILVVEDEADLVELVSYNLKKEGFSVDSALDGETVLTKLTKEASNPCPYCLAIHSKRRLCL